jgi:hypothetical protein
VCRPPRFIAQPLAANVYEKNCKILNLKKGTGTDLKLDLENLNKMNFKLNWFLENGNLT